MQQTSEQKQNKIQNNKGGFFMFKKMKHMKNEKGLTLIELLAVIVILAIVAAIAVPAIGNIINNQRDKAILAELSNAISTAEIAYVDGSCGDDGICVPGDLTFTTNKFTLTNISGLNTTDPTIKFTVTTAQSFKGSKFAVTADTDVKKSLLNKVMQEGN